MSTEGAEREASSGSPDGDVRVLATGAGISFFGRGLGRGLGVLAQIVLARLLGPASFGPFALGWTLFRLGRLTGSLGLEKAVVRYGTEALTDGRRRDLAGILGLALAITSISALLLAGGMIVGADTLAVRVFAMPELAPVLRWFGAVLPLALLLLVVAAATRVSQRMQYGVLAEDMIQPGLYLLLVVLLLAMGWGVTGALVAVATSFLAGLVLGFVLLRRLFPEAFPLSLRSSVSVREMVSFSALSSLGTTFTLLVLRVDRLAVGAFLSATDVGVYEAASQVPVFFSMVNGSFAAIFSPLIVERYARGDAGRLEELYRISTKWALYIVVPCFLLIAVATEEIVLVLFGSAYLGAVSPMLVLAAGQLVNTATGSVGALLVMTGRQRPWFLAAAAALVLDLVLNFTLVPRFGLMGAAFSTAISVSLLFLGGLALVRLSLGPWPYDRRYLKLLVATGVALAAHLAVRQLPSYGPLADLALSAAAIGTSFFVTLALGSLDPEEREVWRSIRTRIGRLVERR